MKKKFQGLLLGMTLLEIRSINQSDFALKKIQKKKITKKQQKTYVLHTVNKGFII